MGRQTTSLLLTLLVTVIGVAHVAADYYCFNFDHSSQWFNSGEKDWIWSGNSDGIVPDFSKIKPITSATNYMWLQEQNAPPKTGIIGSTPANGVTIHSNDDISIDIWRHLQYLDGTYRPVLIFVSSGGIQKQSILWSYNDDSWDHVEATCGPSATLCCDSYPCTGYFEVDGTIKARDEILAFDNVEVNAGCSRITPAPPPASTTTTTTTTTTKPTTTTTTTKPTTTTTTTEPTTTTTTTEPPTTTTTTKPTTTTTTTKPTTTTTTPTTTTEPPTTPEPTTTTPEPETTTHKPTTTTRKPTTTTDKPTTTTRKPTTTTHKPTTTTDKPTTTTHKPTTTTEKPSTTTEKPSTTTEKPTTTTEKPTTTTEKPTTTTEKPTTTTEKPTTTTEKPTTTTDKPTTTTHKPTTTTPEPTTTAEAPTTRTTTTAAPTTTTVQPPPVTYCCPFDSSTVCGWSLIFSSEGWHWSGTNVPSAFVPSPDGFYLWVEDEAAEVFSTELQNVPNYSSITIDVYFQSRITTEPDENNLKFSLTSNVGPQIDLATVSVNTPGWRRLLLTFPDGFCNGHDKCDLTFRVNSNNKPSNTIIAAIDNFDLNKACDYYYLY